jgi:hypothetical protein
VSSVANDLSETVAARWRSELCGVSEEEDAPGPAKVQRLKHWYLRAEYYDAAKAAADDPNIPFNRQQIEELAGHPPSTTFNCFGRTGNHKLITDYRARHTTQYDDLVGLYDRESDAAEYLLDETKVWRYWRHRKGLLTTLRMATDLTRRAAAEALTGVLADWAVADPGLAFQLNYSPPMAAVEDLLVIWGKDAPAAAAHAMLQRVIELALGPLGNTTEGVPAAVRPWLNKYLPPGQQPPADHVAAMTESVLNGILAISVLPEAERRRAQDMAIVLLTDAIDELHGLGGAA